MRNLRERFPNLSRWLEQSSFRSQVMSRTGLLGALSPGGLLAFARTMRARHPRGRDAALVLHASNKPEKLALASKKLRLTYAELDQAALRLAHSLLALGANPGDRVALMMPNCADYVITQVALLRLGATAVQIGYRLKVPEVAYILEHSAPAAVIYHQDFADTIHAAQKSAGCPASSNLIEVGPPGPGKTTLQQLMAREPSTLELPQKSAAEAGLLVYTSGTTGKPKGANRSYAKTGLEPLADLMARVGINHTDRHLVLCPLYHSAAPVFVSMMYALGGTVFVADKFDPEETLGWIERERITSTFMVPTMLARLNNLPSEVVKKYDLSSLRWVMSGAAPLPTEVARAFQERFGKILWNFYGATETGLVSLAGPNDHTSRPGTIGTLLRTNQVRILDPDGKSLPAGGIGELWVANSMLIGGYHKNEEATRASTLDGFFSVGDLARLDADGYLYLESRTHDMIISGGVNIYPREIEDQLLQHAGIADAAIIGVPDPDWGESVCAFVVLKPGISLSADEIVRFCRQRLADYKSPRRIEFVSELPRNPTGKIDKKILRQWSQQPAAASSHS